MAELDTGYAPGGPVQEGPQNGTHGLGEVAREKLSGASDAARRKVVENLDGRKASLSSNLEKWAHEIENMDAGPVGAHVAQYARRAQGLLNEKSTDELLTMALGELKARPGAVIAGSFVLGFLAARVLRK